EFGPAFKGAALVVIPNIYEARDTAKDKRSVSSGALVQELKKNKINAIDGKGMEPTLAYVKTHHKNCDLIITMGAGDVSSIAQKLIG
ncbi:UDP-N-acetylmuramate--L-alanine ligase, partial [Candidatus Peregrinibacteria bacterium CG11_big_fil_rev_8_21_14_0_20_46_8]